MPTTRPRHLVTETDALAAALDDAARRWPGLSRSQLVVRLALEGHRAARAEDERRWERRRAAARAHQGEFPAGTAVRLAELRAATGLRMSDCCVLLAAQESSARVASFDRALRQAADGLGVRTVAV